MPVANVKVTAWLASPIAGAPPELDALLEHVMAKYRKSIEERDRSGKHTGSTTPSRQHPAPPPGVLPIPLKRETIGGWPVARCSSPIYRVDSESEARMATRLRADYLTPRLRDDKIRTIHHGSGSTRAQFRPIRLLHVERVVWFSVAYRHDSGRGEKRMSPSCARAELRRRLKRARAIGRYTAHGYGRVSKWEVEAVDEDRSWYSEDGEGRMVLMRSLPSDAEHPEYLAGYRVSRGAVCPPYWHHDRMTGVLVPC